MNTIAMLGLLPSIKAIYKYKSVKNTILLIIGLINHYHNSNIEIYKIIDRLFCIYVGVYGSYYYKETRKYYYSIPFIFLINYYFYKEKYSNKRLSNVIHVLFIQWPAIYAMYRECEIENIKNEKVLLKDKDN